MEDITIKVGTEADHNSVNETAGDIEKGLKSKLHEAKIAIDARGANKSLESVSLSIQRLQNQIQLAASNINNLVKVGTQLGFQKTGKLTDEFRQDIQTGYIEPIKELLGNVEELRNQLGRPITDKLVDDYSSSIKNMNEELDTLKVNVDSARVAYDNAIKDYTILSGMLDRGENSELGYNGIFEITPEVVQEQEKLIEEARQNYENYIRDYQKLERQISGKNKEFGLLEPTIKAAEAANEIRNDTILTKIKEVEQEAQNLANEMDRVIAKEQEALRYDLKGYGNKTSPVKSKESGQAFNLDGLRDSSKNKGGLGVALFRQQYGEIAKASADAAESQIRDANEVKRAILEESSAVKKLNDTQSTRQFYYAFRSLKMLASEIDRWGKNLSRLSKMLATVAKVSLKSILAMSTGFLTLRRNTDSATRSADKLHSNFKHGLITVLKYTLGIRSLWVAFNKLRSAMNEGFKNLYQYSSKVEAELDSVATSLLQMKNAVAAAVAPLLQVLAPALEYIANLLSKVAYYIASFFAALTGQSVVQKATRAQTKWGDATSKSAAAQEELNKQIADFDKLNVITTNNDNGGGGGASGPSVEDMFDTVPISDKIKQFADWLKDIIGQLFKPLKEAWDKEGAFVLDAWKYALNQIKDLLKDIGRDFLEVWQQPETIEILANILHIIGDIGLIVGNLARNFREAWDENRVGFHILETIRDIIGIIIQHIRNMADATVAWARELNFTPLLQSILTFLEKIKPLVDTIMDLVEYFWTHVVLPLAKFVIETAFPKLLDILGTFAQKIDKLHLKKKLKELMDALEPFIEKFLEALLIIIEDILDAVARFVNGPKFDKIVDSLVKWMKQANPREMAKQIENLVKALIGFKVAFTILKNVVTALEGIGAIINVMNQLGLPKKIENLKKAVGDFGDGIKLIPSYFSELKDSVSTLGLGQTIKSEFGAAIDTLRGKLGKLGTAIVGIGGGATEFLLLKDAAEKLAGGVEDVTTTIGEMVAGGLIGVATLAFAFGPAGALAAALIAIVGMFVGVRKGIDELGESQGINAITKEVEGASFTLDGLQTKFSETKESIMGDLEGIHNDFAKFEQSGQMVADASEDVELLLGAISRGGSEIPGEIDTVTGKVEELADTWKHYVESQYDYLIAQEQADLAYLRTQEGFTEEMERQAQERIENLVNEKYAVLDGIDAQKKGIDELKQARADAIEQYGADSEQAKEATKALVDAEVELQGQVAETTDIFDNTSDSFSKQKEQLEDLNGTLDLSTKEYENYGEVAEDIGTAINNMSDVMGSALEEAQQDIADYTEFANKKWGEGSKEATEAIDRHTKAVMGKYGELSKEYQNAMNKLQEEAAKKGKLVIEDAIKEYENMDWWQKMSLSWTKGINNAEEYAKSQFKDYADAVLTGDDGLVGSIKKAGDNTGVELDPWIDSFAEGIVDQIFDSEHYMVPGAAGAYVSRLSDNWSETYNSAIESTAENIDASPIGDSLDAQLDTVSEDVKSKGSEATSKYAEGVRSNKSEVTDAAVEIADELPDQVDAKKAAIRQGGAEETSLYAEGMSSNIQEVTDAATEITGELPDQVESKQSKVQTAAEGQGNALVSGFKLKEKDVRTEAIAISQIPVQEANNQVGPMRTAGENASKGWLEGFKSIGSTISDAVKKLFGGVIKDTHDTLDEHSPSKVFYDIGDNVGIGFINALKDRLQNNSDIKSYWTNIISSAKDTLGATAGNSTVFKELGAAVMNGFSEGFMTQQPVVTEAFNTIWTTLIQSFKQTFDPEVFRQIGTDATNALVDAITQAIEANEFSYIFAQTLDDIQLDFETTFKEIKTDVTTRLKELKAENETKLGEIKKEVTTKMKSIKKEVNDKVKSIKNDTKTKLTTMKSEINSIVDTIKTNATTKVTSMKTSWVNQIRNLSSGTMSNMQSLYSQMSGVVQQIISLVNQMAQAVIDAVSQTAQAISQLSGMSMGGGGIPAGVPHLASGAVIPPNKEFLAVLGDQTHGTNIEAPLETIVQAFKTAINSSEMQGAMNTNNGDQPINLQLKIDLDGTEIFNSMRNQNQIYINRYGKSAFEF